MDPHVLKFEKLLDDAVEYAAKHIAPPLRPRLVVLPPVDDNLNDYVQLPLHELEPRAKRLGLSEGRNKRVGFVRRMFRRIFGGK